MIARTLPDEGTAVASGSERGPVVAESHTSPAETTAFAGVASTRNAAERPA